MPQKSRYTVERKISIVTDYMAGKLSPSEFKRIYGSNERVLKDWVRQYEAHGVEGLTPASQWRKYSSEIKRSAVLDYLNGAGSLDNICTKYNITGRRVLRRWIKRYNGHEDFSNPKNGGANRMAKGRDTTLEERIEIVGYVTEFKYGDGAKLYLSAILDLKDKSIVSYTVGHSNNNTLAFDTFDAAVRKYPDAKPLFHSDRGFQYTTKVFRAKLDAQNMTQSMSRVGRCIDNGPMEAFWGTLKAEMYYLQRFDDYVSLSAAIANYITFYNNSRYQEKLGGLAPLELRALLLAA